MKTFIQLTIQEKMEGDFRAFLIAENDGNLWELRAYGNSIKDAANNADKLFNSNESEWDCNGYEIPK